MRVLFAKLALILLLISVLSGCMGVDSKVLDEINLATAIGYDYVDKTHFEAIAVTPLYYPDKTIKNITYSSKSSLSKDVRDEMNQQSERPIFSGKLEVVLYEKRLAKQGIFYLIDTLIRDPSIGTTLKLGIVEGSSKDVLSPQFGNIDKGIYLSNTIEQNIKTGMLPRTNLHLFLYAYYSEGMDPFLPIVKALDGKVYIKGNAMFNSKGEYVYQTTSRENVIFKMLYENTTSKEGFSTKIEGREFASVNNIKTKRSYKISKPMTDTPITIDLEIKAILREYTGDEVTPKMIKIIEDKMSKDVKERSEKLVRNFQKLHVDPLGIGEQVRTRTRSWDKKKWDEIYTSIPINVNAKVEILESGVVE
ncbi:Ger(x)C family spore germination protein [Peribacillus frigoritolerans]|uniref:Ger(x)C family spore germination protein n=1 Tax=Peribacillus frigoritolerans TaxID=450367 RepID=UPI0039A242BD